MVYGWSPIINVQAISAAVAAAQAAQAAKNSTPVVHAVPQPGDTDYVAPPPNIVTPPPAVTPPADTNKYSGTFITDIGGTLEGPTEEDLGQGGIFLPSGSKVTTSFGGVGVKTPTGETTIYTPPTKYDIDRINRETANYEAKVKQYDIDKGAYEVSLQNDQYRWDKRKGALEEDTAKLERDITQFNRAVKAYEANPTEAAYNRLVTSQAALDKRGKALDLSIERFNKEVETYNANPTNEEYDRLVEVQESLKERGEKLGLEISWADITSRMANTEIATSTTDIYEVKTPTGIKEVSVSKWESMSAFDKLKIVLGRAPTASEVEKFAREQVGGAAPSVLPSWVTNVPGTGWMKSIPGASQLDRLVAGFTENFVLGAELALPGTQSAAEKYFWKTKKAASSALAEYKSSMYPGVSLLEQQSRLVAEMALGLSAVRGLSPQVGVGGVTTSQWAQTGFSAALLTIPLWVKPVVGLVGKTSGGITNLVKGLQFPADVETVRIYNMNTGATLLRIPRLSFQRPSFVLKFQSPFAEGVVLRSPIQDIQLTSIFKSVSVPKVTAVLRSPLVARPVTGIPEIFSRGFETTPWDVLVSPSRFLSSIRKSMSSLELRNPLPEIVNYPGISGLRTPLRNPLYLETQGVGGAFRNPFAGAGLQSPWAGLRSPVESTGRSLSIKLRSPIRGIVTQVEGVPEVFTEAFRPLPRVVSPITFQKFLETVRSPLRLTPSVTGITEIGIRLPIHVRSPLLMETVSPIESLSVPIKFRTPFLQEVVPEALTSAFGESKLLVPGGLVSPVKISLQTPLYGLRSPISRFVVRSPIDLRVSGGAYYARGNIGSISSNILAHFRSPVTGTWEPIVTRGMTFRSPLTVTLKGGSLEFQSPLRLTTRSLFAQRLVPKVFTEAFGEWRVVPKAFTDAFREYGLKPYSLKSPIREFKLVSPVRGFKLRSMFRLKGATAEPPRPPLGGGRFTGGTTKPSPKPKSPKPSGKVATRPSGGGWGSKGELSRASYDATYKKMVESWHSPKPWEIQRGGPTGPTNILNMRPSDLAVMEDITLAPGYLDLVSEPSRVPVVIPAVVAPIVMPSVGVPYPEETKKEKVVEPLIVPYKINRIIPNIEGVTQLGQVTGLESSTRSRLSDLTRTKVEPLPMTQLETKGAVATEVTTGARKLVPPPFWIFPSKKSSKKLKIILPGTITWHGGLYWSIVPPPYLTRYSSKTPPPGARFTEIRGKGMVKKTLQVIGGPATKDANVRLGFMDVQIRKGSTQITFIPTKRGRRVSVPKEPSRSRSYGIPRVGRASRPLVSTFREGRTYA